MKIRKNGKVINLTESDLKRITESVLLTEGDLFARVDIDKFFKKGYTVTGKNEEGYYTLRNNDGKEAIFKFSQGK